MSRTVANCCGVVCLVLVAGVPDLPAQLPPYDVFPPAESPYYRVRYEASNKPGELIFPVNYTIWIPPGVKTLHGVVVHRLWATAFKAVYIEHVDHQHGVVGNDGAARLGDEIRVRHTCLIGDLGEPDHARSALVGVCSTPFGVVDDLGPAAAQ